MNLRPHQQRFIELALRTGALQFGDFELKSGRRSPYFFNAGAIASGAALAGLGACYAAAIVAAALEPDVLFGPAYKGIPLATATATALYEHHGMDVGVAYDRKEAKSHGEGGRLIGAPLRGRVLIVDDVITAGTAIRAAVGQFPSTATLAGIVIALDRQERASAAADESAVQAVSSELAAPVIAIAGLDSLIGYLRRVGDAAQLAALDDYRAQWGIEDAKA